MVSIHQGKRKQHPRCINTPLTANATKATWTAINESEQLRRSSHNVAVVGSSMYIFGGELKPREPRDNDLFVIETTSGRTETVRKVDNAAEASKPSPRVGSGVARLDKKLYFFSGRGGTAMAPIDEQGALWVFDNVTMGAGVTSR
ncbi:hypothetical protein B0A55_00389 [Friedmanniomyces simplex]|uniref:Uncharacterized protein n=1 Tax=Friedmanniomyces simplex TaxID=329884 RepID=A0A4U0XZS8_9PEZI|nr:hypothetical protein B0A55_00389 [Friedmanniomyces simplex]